MASTHIIATLEMQEELSPSCNILIMHVFITLKNIFEDLTLVVVVVLRSVVSSLYKHCHATNTMHKYDVGIQN